MILLFSFFGLFRQKNNDSPHNIELKSGQIWMYTSRDGEESSRVIILKVEDYGNKGKVVHIAVHGVKIKNERIEGGISKEIRHLPFDKESIVKCLIKLETTTDTLPDFEEGYLKWKDAFDTGKGGIFTISVKEAVDFIDKSLNQ